MFVVFWHKVKSLHHPILYHVKVWWHCQFLHPKSRQKTDVHWWGQKLTLCKIITCMIKIFQGGRGGDTFETPSPYEQLLPLPTPVLRCFWKDPLMTPHHPTSSTFHCYPPPHPPPLPPLTILIIHHMLITNCSLNLSEYFPGMKFCFWHFSFSSRYCRLMHTEKQTLKSLDMHVEFNIFPHWK